MKSVKNPVFLRKMEEALKNERDWIKFLARMEREKRMHDMMPIEFLKQHEKLQRAAGITFDEKTLIQRIVSRVRKFL